MEEKLRSLRESVELIKDGDVVAIGNQKPMALVREIVRQRKKDLKIYLMMGDYEVDMLCATGAISEIHALFVVPAAAPHFRRTVEAGQVKMIDEGEVPLHLGILAGSMNLQFIPLRGYQNDMVTIHPQWKKFQSPVADEELLAIPALVPDVAIIHMPRSDVYGNIQSEDVFVYDRIFAWWDKRIAMASKKTIISVEEIIDEDLIRANPDRTLIPFYEVDVVTEARKGVHPGALAGSYNFDMEHIGIYSLACQDFDQYQAYLEKYVYGVKNNDEYLALIDADTKRGGQS